MNACCMWCPTPDGVLLSWVLAKVEQLWLCRVVHLLVSGDVSDILSWAEVDTLSANHHGLNT